MIIVVLLALTYTPGMQCHLLYPVNYCNMAATCVHDRQMVCGRSPDGTQRSFLDKCDMYEFNCDYGTHFDVTNVSEGNEGNLDHEGNENKPGDEFQHIDDDDKSKLSSENEYSPTQVTVRLNYNDSDNKCDNGVRGWTWMTTVRGETRDFHRILNEYDEQ